MTAHVATSPPAILASTPASAPVLSPSWATLSQALTDEVPLIADRDDLLVRIAPGAGHGAPACFLPTVAMIEVDGVHLGPVDPATAAPHRAADRARYATAWGLLVHECAHARHTAWEAPSGTPSAVRAAAELLEESRIERAQARRRPGDRHWLRASATSLILADTTVLDPSRASNLTARDAAHTAALVLARADSGVLTLSEVEPVSRAVCDIVGPVTFAELRAVWSAAHGVADDDGDTMIALGREWCDILGIAPDAPSTAVWPGGGGAPGAASSGAPGAVAAGTTDPLAQAVGSAVARIADAVSSEPAPGADASAAPGQGGNAQAANAAPARPAAPSVFDPGATVSATGRFAVIGTRPPTDAERQAAHRIGAALTTAVSRERVATRTTSPFPPGRLRMRGALAADAQRAAGAIPTAEPFTRTTRRVVPAPPLRIGIACDVSRSMSAFTRPGASAVWILAAAARHTRVPATSAAVIFGRGVHPITRPGPVADRVTLFSASESLHAVDEAIGALDGVLDLSGPGAARLLVIVSDGIFEPHRREAGIARVAALRATGCGVLWLAPAEVSTDPFDGANVVTLTDPTAIATAIVRAATTALREATRAPR